MWPVSMVTALETARQPRYCMPNHRKHYHRSRPPLSIVRRKDLSTVLMAAAHIASKEFGLINYSLQAEKLLHQPYAAISRVKCAKTSTVRKVASYMQKRHSSPDKLLLNVNTGHHSADSYPQACRNIWPCGG